MRIAHRGTQALDKMPGKQTYHEPGDPKIIAKAPSRGSEAPTEAITSKIVEVNRCSTRRRSKRSRKDALSNFNRSTRCSSQFLMQQSV